MAKSDYLIRYISLGKFIDFLETKSIYLSRIDHFEDETEGEWFSHIAKASNASINDWANQSYLLLEKINKKLSYIAQPKLEDIHRIIITNLTQEEYLGLDISDDLTQVLDSDFFETDEDRIHFLQDVQDSYKEMIQSAEEKEKYFNEEIKEIKAFKMRSYVSSWFSSDSHSIAMWKLYGKNDESVAIRVKKTNLKLIEDDNRDFLKHNNAKILFQNVTYIDENDIEMGPIVDRSISDQEWLDFRNLLLKHNAYKYEEEYRASVIFPENSDNPNGIKLFIQNDLNNFIEDVFLNPLIDPNHWYVNIIKKVLSTYGINPGKLKLGQIKTDFTRKNLP